MNWDIVVINKIISFLDWKDSINFCSCCKNIYRLSKKYENEIWKNKVIISPLFEIENYKKFHINSELGIGMIVEYTIHEMNKVLKTEIWRIKKGKKKRNNNIPTIFFLGYDKLQTTILYITEFYGYDRGNEKIHITKSFEEAQNYNYKTYLKKFPLNSSIKRVSYIISFYELHI